MKAVYISLAPFPFSCCVYGYVDGIQPVHIRPYTDGSHRPYILLS